MKAHHCTSMAVAYAWQCCSRSV